MSKKRLFHFVTLAEISVLFPLPSALLPDNDLKWQGLLISGFFLLSLGYGLNYAIWFLTKTVYRQHQAAKGARLLGSLLVTTILCTLVMVIIFFISWQLLIWESIRLSLALDTIVIFLAISTVLSLISQILLLEKKKQTLQQAYRAAVQQADLNPSRALKTELGPHFLVNSMNNLLQLLREDRPAAEKFLQKLTALYQRLELQDPLTFVSLHDELALLDDYLYLLSIRFGNTIQVHQSLSSSPRDWQILPGTLQLLVENCVKHNRFTASEPLLITIRRQRDQLVVTNALKPLPLAPISTHVGLRNLTSRYALVLGRPVTVDKKNNCFQVSVPLLQTTKS